MSQKSRNSSVDHLIDQNLKKAYEDMAQEPLPSRFTDLLDQLKQGGATPSKEQSGSSDE